MQPDLTKSKFKLAFECPTKLFYVDKNEYANQKEIDSFLIALAEGGLQVEELARCYFPEGIYIQEADKQIALEITQKWLSKKSISLFEAAIRYQHYFIRADILVKDLNHLKLIEVKAKSIDQKKIGEIEKQNGTISAKWKPYIADVAFQKWVLQKAYPDYEISSHLMLVDKDSLCPTDGLNQMFLLEKDTEGRVRVKRSSSLSEKDLSVPILKEINVDRYVHSIWNEHNEDEITFSEQFREFSRYYFNDKKSKPILKSACARCEFKTLTADDALGLKSGFKECWQEALNYRESDFNDPTVLELWDFKDKNAYLKKGIIKLKDFDERDSTINPNSGPGLSPTQRRWLQIEKVKNSDNDIWIDEQGLKHEIDSWTYPLHFIDFETSMPAIPFKKGMHPYQGIAFQYSHHTLDQQGKVSHCSEYLNTDPGVDPSIDFIRSLKRDLEVDSGTILRYSDHENTYLNFILSQLEETSEPPIDKDELCSFIREITKSKKVHIEKWEGSRCMVDLLKVVKLYYYDPLTNGSNSLKHIFPSILNHSRFLQEKYSKPIYGSREGIQSKNFRDMQWIVSDKEGIKDPYLLLGPINKGVPNEKIEFLFDSEGLKDGGAATIAYAKLQFSHMSDLERNELRNALLKYCELDTLAMVMIVEAWINLLASGKDSLSTHF